MINYVVSRLEAALVGNPLCCGGLLIQPKVFVVPQGPSGGVEVLVLVYADDPNTRYWYAHLLRHPQKPRQFVSMIVWSEMLVNASSVPLLFEHFHYFMTKCGAYHPCSIQQMDDAYAESETLRSAIDSLEIMIQRFDIDKRWPAEAGPFAESPFELRILSVYGVGDTAGHIKYDQPKPDATPVLRVV